MPAKTAPKAAVEDTTTTTEATSSETATAAPEDTSTQEQSTPSSEETTLAVVEEVVAPAYREFVAPNTWTAFYGSRRYDFIEGRRYNLSPEAYAWFTRNR